MKDILITILTCLCFTSYAQEKFVAHYDVYPTFETLQNKEDIKNKSIAFIFDGVDDALKNELKYKLEYNSIESLFYAIPFQPTNSKSYRLAKSFAGSFDVYSNKNTSTKVRKKVFQDVNFYVKDTTSYQWTIHNEQRIIDGKTCFKATTKNHVIINKKIKTYEVVAWFSTEFPGYFGIKGYDGLPGLILELVDDKVTFVCSKVEKTIGLILNYNKEKIITDDEFDIKIQKIINYYTSF